MKKILTFYLNGEKYGLEIENIISIERNEREITKIPRSRPNVLGVINVRGDIVTVIDTKSSLRLDSNFVTQKQKLILFNIEEANNSRIALLVDDTDNIIDIRSDQIEVLKSGIRVVSLSKESFPLLDIESIISSFRN